MRSITVHHRVEAEEAEVFLKLQIYSRRANSRILLREAVADNIPHPLHLVEDVVVVRMSNLVAIADNIAEVVADTRLVALASSSLEAFLLSLLHLVVASAKTASGCVYRHRSNRQSSRSFSRSPCASENLL